MSHGSFEKCEPNLTPLLDLVLQLVMFFMICANFVLEQTAVQIKLPRAVAAKALDKNEGDPIYLNVNDKGQVLLAVGQREDRDTLENPVAVEGYLKRRAAVELKKTGKDKPETTLILRVDEKARFKDTYPIMEACRRAGYTKVELRAELYRGQ